MIISAVLRYLQSGLMDDGTKLTLLGVWMALFVVFAGRKFTQPIKVLQWIPSMHKCLSAKQSAVTSNNKMICASCRMILEINQSSSSMHCQKRRRLR